MRRIIGTTAAALLVVGVGVAVAHSDKSIKQVSATFAATTASEVRTSTCTGPDGTYVSSRGTYSGTASGDASLTGPIKIYATSLINTTTGDGIVEGKLSIATSDDHRAAVHFTTVYSDGGIAGLAQGHTASPGAKLVGNLSGGFSSAGGFTDGKLGGGTAGGYAVTLSRGGCRPAEANVKPERVEAHGAITAVSSSSITVAGVTCTVPSNLQGAVSNLKNGDRVEIKCEVANGATTLTRVSGKGSKH